MSAVTNYLSVAYNNIKNKVTQGVTYAAALPGQAAHAASQAAYNSGIYLKNRVVQSASYAAHTTGQAIKDTATNAYRTGAPVARAAVHEAAEAAKQAAINTCQVAVPVIRETVPVVYEMAKNGTNQAAYSNTVAGERARAITELSAQPGFTPKAIRLAIHAFHWSFRMIPPSPVTLPNFPLSPSANSRTKIHPGAAGNVPVAQPPASAPKRNAPALDLSSPAAVLQLLISARAAGVAAGGIEATDGLLTAMVGLMTGSRGNLTQDQIFAALHEFITLGGGAATCALLGMLNHIAPQLEEVTPEALRLSRIVIAAFDPNAPGRPLPTPPAPQPAAAGAPVAQQPAANAAPPAQLTLDTLPGQLEALQIALQEAFAEGGLEQCCTTPGLLLALGSAFAQMAANPQAQNAQANLEPLFAALADIIEAEGEPALRILLVVLAKVLPRLPDVPQGAVKLLETVVSHLKKTNLQPDRFKNVVRHVMYPITWLLTNPKQKIRTGVESVISGAIEAGALTGVANPSPVMAVSKVGPLDERVIQARNARPVPTPAQTAQQAAIFGEHSAKIFVMRGIDYFLGDGLQSEHFYFSMVAGTQSNGEVRDRFFAHLDQSNLFFLTRWVAKVAYFILFPISSGLFQDAALSVFKGVDGLITKISRTAFNEVLSRGLTILNQLMDRWLVNLEELANAQVTGRSVQELVSERLKGPMFHANLPAEEFYTKVTKKAMDEFYEGVSIGKYAYNKLMALQIPLDLEWTWEGVPLGKILCPVVFLANLAIRVGTFPVAALLRILFFLPDQLISYLLGNFIEKQMIDYKVMQDLVQRTEEAIVTNAGLSSPVLATVNEVLEAVILELKNPSVALAAEPRLGRNNQEALTRTVKLALRASKYCSSETVGELKEKVRQESLPKTKHFYTDCLPSTDFDEEVTKGIEDVVILAHQKISNANFMKQAAYDVMEKLNSSLQQPAKPANERDAEFKQLEQRFFDLLAAAVSLAIQKEISKKQRENHPLAPRSTGGTNVAENIVYNSVLRDIEPIIKMISSRNFLRYQVDAVLQTFLNKDG